MQKRAWGEHSVPQNEQVIFATKGAAQPVQKRALSRFSVWHLGQDFDIRFTL